MSEKDAAVREGAERVLARATVTRALGVDALAPRVCSILEKYLLRHQPSPAPDVVRQFLDNLRADDLCLVVACERGEESAWGDLMAQYTPTVRAAARAACGNESDAEELAGSVWAELYGLRRTNAEGQPTGKLAYYSGCGSLGGWLRAVVAQMNIDRHRRTARLVQTEEAADFDRLSHDTHEGIEENFRAAQSNNPEQELERKEAARDLHHALARAVAELPAEDRLLIKLYYYDDLRLREAGAVLGVHEATASRRLARAQKEIRQRTEKILREEKRWTAQEMTRAFADSLLQLTGSDGTDAELRRALMTEKSQRET